MGHGGAYLSHVPQGVRAAPSMHLSAVDTESAWDVRSERGTWVASLGGPTEPLWLARARRLHLACKICPNGGQKGSEEKSEELPMFSAVPRHSVVVDLEDENAPAGMREALRSAGLAGSVSFEEAEALFDQAERAAAAGDLKEAERAFRKVLCSAELERKRDIVRACAHRLRGIRPKVEKPPCLWFADVVLSGKIHMYHFELSKRSEIDRLVAVMADRRVAHDGLVSGELEDSEGVLGVRRIARRLRKGPGISSPTPKNAPCPCGSGHKYKNCCVRTWGRF